MEELIDFGNYMFKSVVMLLKGAEISNGFLCALSTSETDIIPFVITSKSFIHDKSHVAFQYTNKKGKLELGTIELEEKDWYISDEYDIAAYPCGQMMNAIKATQNNFGNIPLIEKMILSSEEEQQLNLIETTYSIGFINAVHNNENCWPMSYVAYTASPISKNFDGKPYFVINSNIPKNILGSPVFVKWFHKGIWGYRLAGMWINQKEIENNVGNNTNFVGILKAKIIFDFIKSIKSKVQQDFKSSNK